MQRKKSFINLGENNLAPFFFRRPANHPFSQSVDWIAKGAAQRGQTKGAVLPVRCLAPEHDPYMTSEHSTTARWNRLGVNFEEGGNHSAWRKPSKSGWDWLKLNPHSRGWTHDWRPLRQPDFPRSTAQGILSTSHGVQHRVFYLDSHPSRYQPHPTGLNFGEQTIVIAVLAVPWNNS